MNLKLTQFETTDNITLPGLLYEPEEKTKKALIWLHGCGSTSVFYSSDRMNSLGEIFINAGISFFPFNNRGAHTVKSLKRRTPSNTSLQMGRENTEDEYERLKMGTAYEIIKECEYDIEGAINYLETLGYNEFYLAGHSTGANKIAIYNYYKPENRIKKYLLLAGGDDTGIYYNILGKKKFKKLLKKSESMIKKDKGEELIPNKLIGDMIYSYKGFYDIANPDGDYNTFPYLEIEEKLKLSSKELFREVKSIKKPVLSIFAESDQYTTVPINKVVNILLRQIDDNHTVTTIPEADHSFNGLERELGEMIVGFIEN